MLTKRNLKAALFFVFGAIIAWYALKFLAAVISFGVSIVVAGIIILVGVQYLRRKKIA